MCGISLAITIFFDERAKMPGTRILIGVFFIMLSCIITGGTNTSTRPRIIYLCVTGMELHASTANSIFALLDHVKIYSDLQIIADVRSSSDLVQLRSAVLTEWFDRYTDQDIFVFVDNDMVFQPEDFLSLLQCQADVCGGLYTGGPAANNRPRASWPSVDEWLAGNTEEAYYTGAGFTAIRRPILQRIIHDLEQELGFSRVSGLDNRRYIPFFQQVITRNPTLLQDQSQPVWMGEDVSFCYRVRKAGGKVKVFYSPTIGHEKGAPYFLDHTWQPKKKTTTKDEL